MKESLKRNKTNLEYVKAWALMTDVAIRTKTGNVLRGA